MLVRNEEPQNICLIIVYNASLSIYVHYKDISKIVQKTSRLRNIE